MAVSHFRFNPPYGTRFVPYTDHTRFEFEAGREDAMLEWLRDQYDIIAIELEKVKDYRRKNAAKLAANADFVRQHPEIFGHLAAQQAAAPPAPPVPVPAALPPMAAPTIPNPLQPPPADPQQASPYPGMAAPPGTVATTEQNMDFIRKNPRLFGALAGPQPRPAPPPGYPEVEPPPPPAAPPRVDVTPEQQEELASIQREHLNKTLE